VSLITSYGFRHVPTLLPLYVTLKCTCIFIYLLSHTYMHVCIWKGIGRNEDFYLGGMALEFKFRVSHLLHRHFYCLSQLTSKFFVKDNMVFQEQFGWKWL
jgi:hypothetical protein